jgi:hypothetical protein
LERHHEPPDTAFEPEDPDDDDGGEFGDCSWDELPLLLEPLLLEPLLLEPLLLELEPVPFELLAEPFPVEPLTAPLLADPLVPELEEPVVPLEWLAVVLCVEPGSALAMPRDPITLTAPTPTVSADSRAIPRFRSIAAALGGGGAG